ncbi:MAG: hypothetical protein LBJ47_02640 [Tannerella sp.]|jgi:hypothetical protein|nr:hypothetical protein [Tannerella sp.]
MKIKIFLLGGYDLEMLTIRKLLEQHNEIFFDGKLRWDNALLSRYADMLKQYANDIRYTVYGVELTEDVSLPRNYYRINHHNEYSDRLSSLEQTAVILGRKLDREQQLIAANDRGYIPAMREMGADDDEIREIRIADRQSQGVTTDDEDLAAIAVANKTAENGIIIVESATGRFSPITDSLFPYEKLLIYTNEELIYYGKGKERLTECFGAEINQGKMYYGGGNNGFIGTKKALFSEEEIIGLKNKIVELLK